MRYNENIEQFGTLLQNTLWSLTNIDCTVKQISWMITGVTLAWGTTCDLLSLHNFGLIAKAKQPNKSEQAEQIFVKLLL